MSRILDLTGKRFGKLVVVEYAGLNDKGKSIWKCKCDCGKEHIAQGSALKIGSIKSCGCYNLEQVQKAHTKKGYFTKNGVMPPEYRVWYAIKQRCFNPNNKDYSNYGGRGVTMYDKWADDFEVFFKDVGQRPGKGYTIDRIDVNGNYEPGNCRWVTMKVQSNNRRSNKHIVINGVCDSLMNWVNKIGCVSYETAKARINVHGWDPFTAITTPVKSKRNGKNKRK
jgi:hypothetical protein